MAIKFKYKNKKLNNSKEKIIRLMRKKDLRIF